MTDDGKWPFYPFYPRDFLADVLLLTDTQELVYRRLLDYQWLNGSVPTDGRDLAAASRVSFSKMKKVWPKIADRFPINESGQPQNRRMERERETLMEKRDRRRAAGVKGAATRWQSDSIANATALRSVCQPEPEPEPEAIEATSVASNATQQFLDRFPEAHHPDLLGYLRAAKNPDATRRNLLALVEGMTDYPIAAEVVGLAVSEMAAAGSRFSIAGVRAFCQNISNRKDTPGTPSESPGERVLRMAAEQDARAAA